MSSLGKALLGRVRLGWSIIFSGFAALAGQELSLNSRSLAFTLQARSRTLSIDARGRAFALQARGFGLSLNPRSTALTISTRAEQ